MKPRKLKFTGVAASAFAAGVMAVQFIRPARTNPQFRSAQMIEATLSRACADCHSDQTRWPWYSGVAPLSWFVINHVRLGHEPLDSIDRLKAMCREVQKGEIPLTSYKLIHWHAWLSAEDANEICAWSETEQKRLSAPPQ